MLPLLGAMAVGGIVGALSSRRSKGEKDAARRMGQATDSEMARATAFDRTAGDSRGRYLDYLENFDPRSYLREEASAFGEDLQEDFVEADAGRRGMLNERGFLGANLSAGHLNREIAKRMARESSRLSGRAAEFEAGRISDFGRLHSEDRAYAEDSRGRYLELLAGGRDYETARRNDRTGSIMGGASLGLGAYRAFK